MRATTLKICAISILLFILLPLGSSAKKDSVRFGYKVIYTDQVDATAYNSLEGQTDSTPWTTAAGTLCREGVIAANHLPIGTKVMIKGFGSRVFVVEDRMNRRYTKRIDIWFRSYNDAIKFGKRKITYYVLET